MAESHDNDEDLVLVERILAAPDGDTRAFEALVLRHSKGILANCRYISGSADDAEDLAQDVFAKAYFALRRFERRAQFRTWLQRIKVNHCLNHVRKSAGRRFDDLQDHEAAPPDPLRVDPRAHRRMERREHRERIARVLDEMTETLRIPLILRDMDEMPYQEIAETLGLGLSAVKMRIKRARADFRERYDQGGRRSEAEA